MSRYSNGRPHSKRGLKIQISGFGRLLAFWDKTDNKETLVIATHGFVKKVDKVPSNEIERAERIRDKYFKNKVTK